MSDSAATDEQARRERLAQRRKSLGMTQEGLAGLLGVQRSTVVRWERGETDPVPWIRPRLAKVLHVSADRLEDLLVSGGATEGRTAGPGTGRGDGGAKVVPRQLPAAADFTGRAAELAALTEILDGANGCPLGTVVISAIGGTAGVGKTALALHWAHQVGHRFTDGQLYVNLRGFDPSGAPAAPAEAVRGFLDALGVPPERIPLASEAQQGLYRSLLADKKMLIVADNARDEQQVRPLLPASPGSMVIVTSRNQLAGLGADGARLLTLDILTHDEAVQLLTARLGPDRAAAEPEVTAEIARMCARLPLALAVAAARAAAEPRFPLSALASELRDSAGRLDILDVGDPVTSVQAVFSWSYQQLSDESARMFRLLGVHPGPDITVPAAASLAATSAPEARRVLDELTRRCLIAEHSPGRYAFHDLLRAYAAGQARDTDTEPERHAAIVRVLDHYLHTASRAALLLNTAHEPVTLPPPSPGTAPELPSDFHQAAAWFEDEHQVLLAAVTLADSSGFSTHTWQLPWAMMPFLDTQGRTQEWAAIQRTALAAATLHGDTAGQAVSSRQLACALIDLGHFDEAVNFLVKSLEFYRRVGDLVGEARVHHGLGLAADRQGRYADALGHSEQALALYRAVGHKAGEANMLNNVGWCHGLLGDYDQARAFCRQALSLSAEVGHRLLEANSWDSLGYAERHLSNFPEAVACYERAISLFTDSGYQVGKSLALADLGETYHAADAPAQAADAWRRALAILEDLGHPDASKVRAKLASVSDCGPAASSV